MGEESQKMMGFNAGRQQMAQVQGEAKLNAQRGNGMPSGMRLPMMATKGKMGANPSQLFDSDNESIYDSDGEYESM